MVDRPLTYRPSDLIYCHGTSSIFLPTIRSNGLQPRKAREKISVFKGSIESNPEYIYLALADWSESKKRWYPASVSISAARQAVEKFGGEQMILYLRLRRGDADALTIDEDASIWVCPKTHEQVRLENTPKWEDLPKEVQEYAFKRQAVTYDQNTESYRYDPYAIREFLPPQVMKPKDISACERETKHWLPDSHDRSDFLYKCQNFLADYFYRKTQGVFDEEKKEWIGDERTPYLQKPLEVSEKNYCLDSPIWMKSLIGAQTLAVGKTIPFDRVVQVDILDRDHKGMEYKWDTMCGGLPSWDLLWDSKKPESKVKSMKVTARCRRQFANLGA